MARSLASKTNVNPPAGDYPYGRIRDNDGTGNGTPVNEQVYGDFHQFFARLMAIAGLAFNGLPDNNYSGFQYITALLSVITSTASALFTAGVRAIFRTTAGTELTTVNILTKVIEIGDWNMDTTNAVSISHGVTQEKIRMVSAIIRNDADSDYSNICKFSNADDGTYQGGVDLSGSAISVRRLTGGEFDSAAYDSTSFNRGWITILYEQ